jgi:hypothetical protein
MHIDLDAVQQAITLFQTDGNTYVHNDMGITNAKAKSLMERSEVIVFGFLETEDKDEDGEPEPQWEVIDCVNALIQEVRLREGYLTEAEKLFFLMHGYSVLMDNLDHIPVIDFDLN